MAVFLLSWRAAWLKPAVFIACLIPAASLLWRLQRDNLGPNPVEEMTHVTGDWAIYLLLLSLAITPARRLLHAGDLIRFRRMLGLFAFFYACAHLFIWMYFDKAMDRGEMLADVTKRRFIMAGLFSLVVMVPLAVTSTKWAIRRMGRNWRRLHRTAYVATGAAVIHYYWLVKSDTRWPLLLGGILITLLAFRIMPRRPVLRA